MNLQKLFGLLFALLGVIFMLGLEPINEPETLSVYGEFIFDVHATVFDAGEAVDSVSINLDKGAWNLETLTPEAFTVLASHLVPGDTRYRLKELLQVLMFL